MLPRHLGSAYNKDKMISFNYLAKHDLSFGPDEFVNNDTGRSALITTTAMSV